MPKVNQEYIAEKKRSILDATIRVCKSKPVYAVTLRDVVKECNISQGGLYHYFKDIDEIFAEILNRCFMENKIAECNYKIFESNMSLHEIIIASFATTGQLIDDVANQYGGFIYELNSIYLTEIERGLKVENLIQNHSDVEMFLDKTFSLIEAHIKKSDFELPMSMESLKLLVAVTIQGIQQYVTFSQTFHNRKNEHNKNNNYKTAKEMMVILAHSINGMLQLREE